jgi:hypothetical protein
MVRLMASLDSQSSTVNDIHGGAKIVALSISGVATCSCRRHWTIAHPVRRNKRLTLNKLVGVNELRFLEEQSSLHHEWYQPGVGAVLNTDS